MEANQITSARYILDWLKRDHGSISNKVLSDMCDEIIELGVALQTLVDLKNHKDKHGKDEYYFKQQPIAWERAKEILNQDKKPDDPDDNQATEDTLG